eukprot:5432304-Alexandrium_andersonii.AAC.1
MTGTVIARTGCRLDVRGRAGGDAMVVVRLRGPGVDHSARVVKEAAEMTPTTKARETTTAHRGSPASARG